MGFANRYGMMVSAMSNASDLLTRNLAILGTALQRQDPASERMANLLDLQDSLRNLLDEFADAHRTAEAALLVSPLTHEFNNFINAVLLWLAVLDSTVPAVAQGESVELRRQAKLLASAIQLWQRRRPPPPTGLQDINQALRSSVSSLLGIGGEIWGRVKLIERNVGHAPTAGASDISILLELSPNAPAVLGSALELESMCSWLAANAVFALPPEGGRVAIRTSAASGKLTLSVHDTGFPVPEHQLDQLFDPCHAVRPGTNSLELAACQSLAVKRFHGSIRGENQVPGGFAIIVEIPIL